MKLTLCDRCHEEVTATDEDHKFCVIFGATQVQADLCRRCYYDLRRFMNPPERAAQA